jgi:hypothetical protein
MKTSIFYGIFIGTFFMAILASLPLEAKVFRNAYVSFELPDTWKCNLEHTEWVCRSESSKESKEAIIILTAKEVGPTDSFSAYTQHLGSPQPTQGKGGSAMSRVVYPPKQVKINDHIWIDGLHMASEVPNYFTRYLTTIKDRIAVLVTLSAHKNFYTKYSQDFFKSVMSLRVIATANLLNNPQTGPLRPGGDSFGPPGGMAMPADINGSELALGEGENGDGQGGKTKTLFFGIAFVLMALAGYVFIKMKRK